MSVDKVIATDLDGTLFYPKKRFSMIPKMSRRFLERFTDDGGRLVIVSGRGRYFGEKVANNLERKVDVIGCNGAFVMVNGEMVKETFFPTESLKKMISEVRREFKMMFISLFCKHRNFVIDVGTMKMMPRFAYRLYEISQGTYHEQVTKSEKIFYEELEKGEVYKVLLFVGPRKKSIKRSGEITELLSIRYPEFEFAWSNQAIEVTPKGCTKSSGIAFYLDYNHISNDNVLVVGDSGNDISMFESYRDNSFCMAHADQSVKEHAKHTIKHFSDLEKFVYPSVEND
jgi:Cof subfamily protein (haloacid dehalogenase superfamily)